jgi:sugar phosphate isomerase/epimerase
MLSQTWPDSRERVGDTEKAFECALSKEFFTSFQTVEVPDAGERRAIARLLERGDFFYDYCVARVLNENGLNLSDPEAEARRTSAQKVIDCLDDAREAGADTITVISGPRPDREKDRAEALKRLSESLARIATEAAKAPAVGLVIEPLDVEAHKRMSLGYTSEAAEMCRRLQREGLSVRLLLDTAHMILNDEDPVRSLRDAMEVTSAFHYCNCVTDATHPLYGDRHIRFGAPGVIAVDQISEIMRAQTAMGFFDARRRPPIMCEVLKRDGEESVELMDYCAAIIADAWESFGGGDEEA